MSGRRKTETEFRWRCGRSPNSHSLVSVVPLPLFTVPRLATYWLASFGEFWRQRVRQWQRATTATLAVPSVVQCLKPFGHCEISHSLCAHLPRDRGTSQYYCHCQYILALAFALSRGGTNKRLVVAAAPCGLATSILPPSRSRPAISRNLMRNPFRGASGSSECFRLRVSFNGSDNQQRKCRGWWTASRYLWTWHRSRPTGSLLSSQPLVVLMRSSNITMSGRSTPSLSTTDGLLAIQRCQGEGRTTRPMVREVEG